MTAKTTKETKAHVDDKTVGKALTHNLYRFNELIIQGENPNSALSPRPHQELCDVLQDWSSKRRKLVLMPRGSFKSSVGTVGYAIQQIAANPNIRILIGSEVNATAKKFLREIKDNFEDNQRLRHYYGEHVRSKSRWTDDEIQSKQRTRNFKEPTVFTTGTDQSRTGFHCDLAILDDPVSITNINTKESREKTLAWYREISNNILDPDGHLIVIGTRWHYSDLYQHILDNEAEEFDIHIKEAMTDRAYHILISDRPIEDKVAIVPEEELLFPARLGMEELWSKYKSVGSSMFANQYLNKVQTAEDSDFNIDQVQYYDPFNEKDKLRMRELNTYISVDPAFSVEEKADYTAIVVVGIDEFNNWFVLDYEFDHMKVNEMMEHLFRLNQQYRPRKIGVEANATQKSLMYSIKDAQRNKQIRLPVAEKKRETTKGKEQRIREVLQPIIEQKRLHIQTGMLDLIEEIRTQPRAKNDDLLDALADIAQVSLGFRHKRSRGTIDIRHNRDPREERARPQFSVERSKYTKY